MDNSVIAKSGWLLKRSSNSSKWEKNWVELYRDGFLKYYESDHSPNAEDVIFMPRECILVKTGIQVVGVKPPETHSHQCLFSVSSNIGNKIWYFCGQSLEEMRGWQLALEQSRLILSPRHQLYQSLNRYTGPQSPYCSYINSQSLGFMPSLTNERPIISSSLYNPFNTSLNPYYYNYSYNAHNPHINRLFLPLSQPSHQLRGISDSSALTGASMVWSESQKPFWW